NTDVDGIAAAVMAASGARDAMTDQHALVLGAGGAARAAVAALLDMGARVTVTNRTEAKARALSEAFGVSCLPWETRSDARPALIVNATSVGMAPQTEATPWPREAFAGVRGVVETVYDPARTRFLREAQAA